MFEHQFVRIKLSGFSHTPEEDYHTLVYEHEKDGGSKCKYSHRE